MCWWLGALICGQTDGGRDAKGFLLMLGHPCLINKVIEELPA